MLAHRTPYSSCLVRHRKSRRAQSQSSNGRNPNGQVTWLLHRTCPVCTGLSGAPGKIDCKLFTFGISQKPTRYNSPDCPVFTGQCPVLQEDAALNSPVSGIRIGCFAIIHRTCPV